MDKKKAHAKAGSNDKSYLKENSTHNQRLKLLAWFREKNSITTKQAQNELDIYHPPARIKELRQAGYVINTVWDYWISEYGIKHRIGRYILVQKTFEKASSCNG